MKKRKVLVTGGAGFIGNHLVCELVAQNWEVTVLDNCSAGNKICPHIQEKIDFINGDVRNIDIVFRAARNCNVIVHLAAVVGVDEVINRKTETIETETIGTYNIIEAARRFNVEKIIYASSSAVYKNSKGSNSSEDDELDLVNAYAVAKRMNELFLNSLSEEEGISTNSLRFFNVYGGKQDCRMVVPRFLQQAMQNEPIEVFGDGTQTRDFTYIDDVVNTIISLTDKNSVNGIFNVSRGVETTIKELAELIIQVTRSKSKVKLLDFPTKRNAYKVNRRVGNSKKLKSHLGINPEILLRNGLEKYFQEKLKLSRVSVRS